MFTEPTIILLERICNGITVTTGILILWFKILDAGQSKETRERTKEKYAAIWITVNDLKAKELPLQIVKWLAILLNSTTSSIERFFTFALNQSVKSKFIAFILPLLLGGMFGAAWYFDSNKILQLFLMYAFLTSAILIFIVFPSRGNRDAPMAKVFSIANFIHLVIYPAWIIGIDSNDSGLLALLITIPIFTLFKICNLALFLVSTGKRFSITNLILPAFSVPFSFFITALSIHIGNSFYDLEKVSLTLEILFWNSLFDLFTISATIYLINRAINQNKSLLKAIFIDVLCATGFSFSLMMRVKLFSGVEVVPLELLHLFLGLDQTGSYFEFGPYFWLMHSTFIPTMFYLGAICSGYVAKYIILPIVEFFSYRHSAADKPHIYTVSLLAFLGGILGVIPGIMIFLSKP